MQRPCHAERGLTTVELLVGAALGLFVVAGAVSLFVTNVGHAKRLLVEARVNQDLRVAADLITRDLKRAGYWANALAGTSSTGATVTANAYSGIGGSFGSSASQIKYRYARDDDDAAASNERFGFRLQSGVVQMQIAEAPPNWQSITDPGVVVVTRLEITATETEIATGGACPKACPPPPGALHACSDPPRLTVRHYDVLLQGRAAGAGHEAIQRELLSSVRVRNDRLSGACPA